jgi:hypothetical protein
MALQVCALPPIVLLAGAALWAQTDELVVTLTPAVRQYCHVVRFPNGWSIDPLPGLSKRQSFGSDADYEFRVQGILGTEFLVAGYNDLLGPRQYTLNQYHVDFSKPTMSAEPVNRRAWEAATTVPFVQRSIFPTGEVVPNETRAEFGTFKFVKSGRIWVQPSHESTRWSPDQTWLVLQSNDVNNDRSRPTKVFLDVFNTNTGNKLLTIEGIFTSRVGQTSEAILRHTGWLTERYFIVPLGPFKERALVCEFGRSTSPKEAKK